MLYLWLDDQSAVARAPVAQDGFYAVAQSRVVSHFRQPHTSRKPHPLVSGHVISRKCSRSCSSKLQIESRPSSTHKNPLQHRHVPFFSLKMALQPCRAGLARGCHLFRSAASLRACYTTESSSSSSSSSTTQSPAAESASAPRWSRTPPAMKAPIQMDFSKNPKNKIWVCNSDPHVLDDMYNRLLGPGGSKMLPEELKWLAVTHKSFDHGRRGFNDRLALLGRSAFPKESVRSCRIEGKMPLRMPDLENEPRSLT